MVVGTGAGDMVVLLLIEVVLQPMEAELARMVVAMVEANLVVMEDMGLWEEHIGETSPPMDILGAMVLLALAEGTIWEVVMVGLLMGMGHMEGQLLVVVHMVELMILPLEGAMEAVVGDPCMAVAAVVVEGVLEVLLRMAAIILMRGSRGCGRKRLGWYLWSLVPSCLLFHESLNSAWGGFLVVTS